MAHVRILDQWSLGSGGKQMDRRTWLVHGFISIVTSRPKILFEIGFGVYSTVLRIIWIT